MRVLKTVSFGEDAHKRLAALRQEVGANSDSEVVRRALQVYEYFVRESKNGAIFLVQQGSEKPRPLQPFF